MCWVSKTSVLSYDYIYFERGYIGILCVSRTESKKMWSKFANATPHYRIPPKECFCTIATNIFSCQKNLCFQNYWVAKTGVLSYDYIYFERGHIDVLCVSRIGVKENVE